MTGPAHHHAAPSPVERRVAALEELLSEKGLVTPEFIDGVVSLYENDIGPLNGAKVVARAWVDPDYRERLLADGTAAIAELGIGGPQGEHMVVVENTDAVHNVVVCTLCSCYPWPVLGLPPVWYKAPPYRARMVREPRAKPGPRSHGENHAARPAMQVQDQIAAGRSSADLIDITIVLKDGGESRFDHDCDFEVGPVRLEK